MNHKGVGGVQGRDSVVSWEGEAQTGGRFGGGCGMQGGGLVPGLGLLSCGVSSCKSCLCRHRQGIHLSERHLVFKNGYQRPFPSVRGCGQDPRRDE